MILRYRNAPNVACMMTCQRGGVGLRRTFRSVAADCGVDEMLAHFLMGHAPAGISQRYVARTILSSGAAMRDAQRKISKRIVALLGIERPPPPAPEMR
jgi:integrase